MGEEVRTVPPLPGLLCLSSQLPTSSIRLSLGFKRAERTEERCAFPPPAWADAAERLRQRFGQQIRRPKSPLLMG